MTAAVAVSCEKPDDTPDVVPPEPLVNQISWNDELTDIKSVFVNFDLATGEPRIYLSELENVTDVAQLEGSDYISFFPGENINAEPGTTEVTVDLLSAPEGFVFEYVKSGSTVFEVSSSDHSAISEGSLTATLSSETSITFDGEVVLTSDDVFRFNAVVNAEDIEIGISEPEYPENPMTFVYNGEETPVGSVSIMPYNEYILITASPDVVETVEELFERDDEGFYVQVGSINSIFYFLHKAAEPFNCLEQDNLA